MPHFLRHGRLTATVLAGAAAAALAAALLHPAPAKAASGQSAPGPVTGQAINDLARTPYLGWNTYYGLGSSFDEQTIEAEADAIVDRGLQAAGYEYVWIDGGWWNGDRDATGRIAVSAQQWPHGMKAVADYIHSKGLKAGIYTDAGVDGCGGSRQGSFGHYQQDADTFAAWGYDAVKVDFCGGHNLRLDPATQYGQFRDALLDNSSRRPMLLNICNPFVPETGAPEGQSAYDSWSFGPTTGNSWRTDTDIGFVRNVQFKDLLRNLDHDAAHPEAAGPGHWNDPDYLAPELGFTATEARTQFSMWSVLAAPLIVGSDVRSLSAETIGMLTNREVLAIDQDPLGRQGTAIATNGDGQVWVRELEDGDRAVALFNRGETATTISTTAAAAGLRHSAAYAVRDVWKHTTYESGGKISAAVAPHGVVLFRVSPRTGDAGTEPLVSLAPVSTPAAYPGSQLRLAVPGSTLIVTSRLENDARRPITEAAVTLAAPDGWTVSPAATDQVGTLPTGRARQLSWTVSVPDAATAGSVDLQVLGSYAWGDQAHHVTVTSDAAVLVPPPAPTADTVLAHHDWLRATSGWLTPQVDQAVGGGPLRISGTAYETGLGVASPSDVEYYLGGRCDTLTGTVGIDDSTNFDPNGGTSTFEVLGDGQQRYDSGLISRPETKAFSVDVGGAQVVTLHVGDGDDGGYNDRTDWADLQLSCD